MDQPTTQPTKLSIAKAGLPKLDLKFLLVPQPKKIIISRTPTERTSTSNF